MSRIKEAMLHGIIRKEMRDELESIRNEYALYLGELRSNPPKRKLSTKDKIILKFLEENECGSLIFQTYQRPSHHDITYNKGSGEFSFKTAVNINYHGIGQFPFFESLDHILLPYLLESVQEYLVWCEGDEIIHLDENGNPTDDLSFESKEINEIMVWTDLTEMIKHNITTRSWERVTDDDLWNLDYCSGNYPASGPKKFVRLLSHYDCETGERAFTKKER